MEHASKELDRVLDKVFGRQSLFNCTTIHDKV